MVWRELQFMGLYKMYYTLSLKSTTHVSLQVQGIVVLDTDWPA
jgi:hypothetical protein